MKLDTQHSELQLMDLDQLDRLLPEVIQDALQVIQETNENDQETLTTIEKLSRDLNGKYSNNPIPLNDLKSELNKIVKTKQEEKKILENNKNELRYKLDMLNVRISALKEEINDLKEATETTESSVNEDPLILRLFKTNKPFLKAGWRSKE